MDFVNHCVLYRINACRLSDCCHSWDILPNEKVQSLASAFREQPSFTTRPSKCQTSEPILTVKWYETVTLFLRSSWSLPSQGPFFQSWRSCQSPWIFGKGSCNGQSAHWSWYHHRVKTGLYLEQRQQIGRSSKFPLHWSTYASGAGLSGSCQVSQIVGCLFSQGFGLKLASKKEESFADELMKQQRWSESMQRADRLRPLQIERKKESYIKRERVKESALLLDFTLHHQGLAPEADIHSLPREVPHQTCSLIVAGIFLSLLNQWVMTVVAAHWKNNEKYVEDSGSLIPSCSGDIPLPAKHSVIWACAHLIPIAFECFWEKKYCAVFECVVGVGK